MLKNLIMLPCEVLGHNVLGFLELIDIIQRENASSSHESQQLLRAILPYCACIILSDKFLWKHEAINWFNKRQCRVQCSNLCVKLLCDVDFEHSILHNIEICMHQSISLNDTQPLRNTLIYQNLTSVKIKGKQDPTVMEVFFSLLSNSSRVRSLNIKSSNLSQWMENIKKIGPYLREFFLNDNNTDIKTITEYCPYLEKLSLQSCLSVSRNILQNIANNCSHLRRLVMHIPYNTDAECQSDLTAFAEECPQLEELSLCCRQLTDQSVIALSQHCSRLKKLKFYHCKLTFISMIALSKRGLPLEELEIPWIPIVSTEIAAHCAHALSRIQLLGLRDAFSIKPYLYYTIPYMTGMREMGLLWSVDHLLVPQLLLLLQQGHCADLSMLYITKESSITSQQLCELVTHLPQLDTLYSSKHIGTTDALLVELAHSCPQLQKVILYSSSSGNVTEEGVVTLTTHCRQLREIHIPLTTVTEETVRQLAQHCRRLTKVHAKLSKDGQAMEVGIGRKPLRAMREQSLYSVQIAMVCYKLQYLLANSISTYLQHISLLAGIVSM